MRTTLFAFVGAASIVLAGPVAFAGSDAYPDLPGQAIYASPPSTPSQAEAYQDAGPASAPLSAATAVNGTGGAEAMPEFAGAPAMFGTPNTEVARKR